MHTYFQEWLKGYFPERAESMVVVPVELSAILQCHPGHWCIQPVTHRKLPVEMITHHWEASYTEYYMHELSTCPWWQRAHICNFVFTTTTARLQHLIPTTVIAHWEIKSGAGILCVTFYRVEKFIFRHSVLWILTLSSDKEKAEVHINPQKHLLHYILTLNKYRNLNGDCNSRVKPKNVSVGSFFFEEQYKDMNLK